MKNQFFINMCKQISLLLVKTVVEKRNLNYDPLFIAITKFSVSETNPAFQSWDTTLCFHICLWMLCLKCWPAFSTIRLAKKIEEKHMLYFFLCRSNWDLLVHRHGCKNKFPMTINGENEILIFSILKWFLMWANWIREESYKET